MALREYGRKSVFREIVSTSMYILFILAATYLIITFVGQRAQVSGQSMEYTLADKDSLIVDKITYKFKEPERFDIIVFPYQKNEDTYYIKRIIGMPGETVQIDNGAIYINGAELAESYGKEIIISAGRAAETVTLGAEEYFVLGDNRNDSSDSRDEAVGNIRREEIIGKAWMRILPISKIGLIKHR